MTIETSDDSLVVCFDKLHTIAAFVPSDPPTGLSPWKHLCTEVPWLLPTFVFSRPNLPNFWSILLHVFWGVGGVGGCCCSEVDHGEL